MIEYKAVAMDLDDTLLTSDLQISEETKQTLLQCQKDGMHVILASGRPIYAIEKYAKELELEKYGGYIVGFNGAAVRDCKAKRMIMQRNLPMEYIKMLYNLSVENGVYIHTYVGDEIITPQNNQYTEVEGELTGMPIRETEDFVKAVNQEVVKVLMHLLMDYWQINLMLRVNMKLLLNIILKFRRNFHLMMPTYVL